MAVEHDEIGIWSEVKLAIVKKYAAAYTTVMDAQRRGKFPRMRWLYIDGYAGSGHHISKTRKELVEGSPLIALNTQPPFHEYHFIDSDTGKAAELRKEAGERTDVHIYSEDCNEVLLTKVFPRADYGQYKRALCLLDPYNINLTWEVIEAAGKARSIEIFVNFMIMDINRNALRRNPDKSIKKKVDQMTRLWGDDSWLGYGYDHVPGLFEEMMPVKVPNERFAEAFRQRLITKAGFKCVPKPMPMKTKMNAVIYYLFFASQKDSGMDIVNDIFNQYRMKQGL
ncbi:three-Cys-motif partner protein TcmP [Paludibaculum fermentans]|uniref:three-Cys-motif partner protein TcmP n=1 Tax=Paludibaculum fermentans TaxID=1473598 RepID=UPI003EC0152E